MLRRFLTAALACAVLSCGPSSHRGAIPEALRGLPPHKDPAVDLTDDDDLARARWAYDALPSGDERARRREELWGEYQRRVLDGLGHDDRERAFQTFQQAVSMWRPDELDDVKTPAPQLDMATELATTIYTRFAATGSDMEAVTALAVLVAAHPERTREIDGTWNEIQEYEDSLAIADNHSVSAERMRPIAILEDVTEWFPSRWAGEKLVQLYLARQQAVDAAVKAGGDPMDIVAIQHSATWPVVALVRVYARMGRVDEALHDVDEMAGEFGDMPKLRDALRAATGKDAKATSWTELAGIFTDENEEFHDWRAALSICETGARRFPQAPEPPFMAAVIAAQSGHNVPLAIRYAEQAHKLAPADVHITELLARLYSFQINDLVLADRIDEGRARLKALETFLTGIPAAGKDDPIPLIRVEAYQHMGVGLYAAGQISEAVDYFQKASKIKVTAEAVEQLATIADKRGNHKDAEKLYQRAAQLHLAPDSTDSPLEQRMQEARLRRMAGEALARAGDKGGAETQWMHALEMWPEVMSSANDEHDVAIAFSEIGRLRYYLGKKHDALHAFEQAIDADSEGASTYGDVIAFLVTRGEYDAARDAWHRALGRNEVSEYFKVYTTLWVRALAKIHGETPDPAGEEYLASRTGKRWYHDLARYASGQLSYEGLVAKADTRGKRAEAMFYRALDRYAAKDNKGAETLLRGVVSTDMFGFFEFDMATYFLEHGPP